jgi:hypothetical protein
MSNRYIELLIKPTTLVHTEFTQLPDTLLSLCLLSMPPGSPCRPKISAGKDIEVSHHRR